jgi:hypothetical protein
MLPSLRGSGGGCGGSSHVLAFLRCHWCFLGSQVPNEKQQVTTRGTWPSCETTGGFGTGGSGGGVGASTLPDLNFPVGMPLSNQNSFFEQ